MLFRRTNRYGYARYYSNGGPAYVIKIIVTIVLLLALVGGGIFFAVNRYQAFVEKGGKFPWENWGISDDVNGGVTPDTLSEDTSEDGAESSAPGEGTEKQGFFARIGAFFAAKPAEGDGSVSESGSDSGAGSSESAGQESGAASSGDGSESTGSTPMAGDTSADTAQPEKKQGFFAWLLSLFQPKQAANNTTDSGASSGAASSGDTSADTGDTSAAGSAPSEQEEESQPKAELQDGLRLQHVTIKDLTGGDVKSTLEENGANGIMLFMKESGGKLNYTSSEDIAEELDVCTDEDTGASVAEQITSLKNDGYYVLVYVDCFQDQIAGVKSQYSLHDGGGAPWYDDEARAWVDPANEDFQSYLIGVIKELAELGCDEIVLNNACYPSTGTVSILSDECYVPSEFTSIVNDFYAKIAEETADTSAVISLATSAEAIRGEAAETTGQTAENMLQLGGRLWVECDEDEASELQALLEDAGYGQYTLGRIVGSLDESGDGCQVVLD